MSLKCSICKKDSGLDGQVSGTWICNICIEANRIKNRLERITRTHVIREEIRLGKRQAVLVPGKRLPLITTDDEAQIFADENYGIEWERTDKDVIIWCEL